MYRSLRFKRGVTLIEVLVVVLILSILVAICLPLYFTSVNDSEVNGCKTNMTSIATAVQAQRTRTQKPYFVGPVDATSTAIGGPLEDLHNNVPHCPADLTDTYTVSSDGSGGFIIRCSDPKHNFQWHNGSWETY
jgi:prepilin-type N-terminal cleavage/methylation domain-containing protein